MKILSTTEVVIEEISRLYEQIDAGDLTPEDRGEVAMKLSVLKAAGDLVKSNVLEAKLEQLEQLVEQRMGSASPLKRVS
jgi:hypothetical protein